MTRTPATWYPEPLPDDSITEIDAPPDVKPLLYESRNKKYMRGGTTSNSSTAATKPRPPSTRSPAPFPRGRRRSR
jgi:hypothetical protein